LENSAHARPAAPVSRGTPHPVISTGPRPRGKTFERVHYHYFSLRLFSRRMIFAHSGQYLCRLLTASIELPQRSHLLPKGSTSKVKETFRLVGVLDKESKTYHFYLTNITPEQLSAEDVALLYRARWSIELVFKELKRLYQLDVISSGAPAVVESLVLVAMLTLVVSHRLLNHMRLLAPEKSARFTPLRWAESFYSIAPVIMARVLKFIGIDEGPLLLIIYFMAEGVDPNVNRERLLSPWVR
jgi:hypothetical protein